MPTIKICGNNALLCTITLLTVTVTLPRIVEIKPLLLNSQNFANKQDCNNEKKTADIM